MPIAPDPPGGSYDPTRANDPIDPTRAQDPIDPTRVQPGVDPARAQDATFVRPAPGAPAPLVDEPLRRDPDDRDRKGPWWPWALLAAVLIGIVAFALLQDGDDDDAVGTADQTEIGPVETVPEDTAVEDTTAETAPEDTTADDGATDDTTATTAAADTDDTTAPSEGAVDGAGTVTTADGTDLLTQVEGDAGDAERLAPYADQDVTGAGVPVLEVVEGEGFWIGTDDRQRIFAHLSSDAADEVEVGQRIDFDGFLEANPPADSAEAHDIPEDQGAELLGQQGHHLELRSMTVA